MFNFWLLSQTSESHIYLVPDNVIILHMWSRLCKTDTLFNQSLFRVVLLFSYSTKDPREDMVVTITSLYFPAFTLQWYLRYQNSLLYLTSNPYRVKFSKVPKSHVQNRFRHNEMCVSLKVNGT